MTIGRTKMQFVNHRHMMKNLTPIRQLQFEKWLDHNAIFRTLLYLNENTNESISSF